MDDKQTETNRPNMPPRNTSTDGLIVSQDPEWIQVDRNVLVVILYRVGLMDNVAKYRTMTFHPRVVHIGISEDNFNRRRTRDCATYQECLWHLILCPYSGV